MIPLFVLADKVTIFVEDVEDKLVPCDVAVIDKIDAEVMYLV